MKFLITIDDSRQKAQDTAVQMEARKRWLATSRKKGTVEAIYSLAGNHGAVMIVDVENHEALDELMIAAAPCNDALVKIMPLADYDVAMNRLGKHFKASLRSKATKAKATRSKG